MFSGTVYVAMLASLLFSADFKNEIEDSQFVDTTLDHVAGLEHLADVLGISEIRIGGG